MTNDRPDGEVEFSFFLPAARSVCLVGDFNRWSLSATPMRRAEGGWWRCQLRLHPGAYRFKYYADGTWYLDYGAFGLEPPLLGGWNSRLWVSARCAPEEIPTARGCINEVDLRTSSLALAA